MDPHRLDFLIRALPLLCTLECSATLPGVPSVGRLALVSCDVAASTHGDGSSPAFSFDVIERRPEFVLPKRQTLPSPSTSETKSQNVPVSLVRSGGTKLRIVKKRGRDETEQTHQPNNSAVLVSWGINWDVNAMSEEEWNQPF
eukprot:PhM_4_TR11601/c0_g1_i1/m.60650